MSFPFTTASLHLCAAAVLAISAGTCARAQSTSDLPVNPSSTPTSVPTKAPADAPAIIAVSVQNKSASQLPSYPPFAQQPGSTHPLQVATQSPARPASAVGIAAYPPYDPNVRPYIRQRRDDGSEIQRRDWLGSTYIPVDSWVYPAALRLYSLGYLDTAYIAMRPWTRRSLLHMLDTTESDVRFDNNPEAVEILDKLYYELREEPSAGDPSPRGLVNGVDSAYVGIRPVGGTVLRDSFHLGQSFNNDYGRPYSNGLNSYNGFSTVSEFGPFSLYVRGEYQHAPSYGGYSLPLATLLVQEHDGQAYAGYNRPQDTVPEGPLSSQNNFRLLEANLSAHVYGHEVSFGKSDAWLGPGLGGSMAWSNNAENMYTFRINRVEPLHIPYVSRVLGNIRYDFFIGSLKGHTAPNDPWAHSEMIEFAPYKDFHVSFQRSIIFGGKGHEPVTLHTFFKGFFDINDTTGAEKFSRDDPGARYSSVTFSWRLPFLRKDVTLYTDSTTHDDVFPISAPRRAGWRPGIYFSHLPWAPKLDLRVEADYTDYPTSRSVNGSGNYWENIQVQGYTNKGFIMGDWIGREAKGGQAWLTYHLSGNEWVSVQYLRKKNGKDFVDLGTTQNIYRVDAVKRLRRDVELTAFVQIERWKAPIWMAGQQSSNSGALQVTWYPRLKTVH